MADSTPQSSDIGNIDESIISDVFDAISEAPEADHGKIFKIWIMDALETIKNDSVLQLDLFEKAAFIAINNVQDVRLFSIEKKIEEMEQGKPVVLGDILIELVFSIVVEAALIAGVELAIPAMTAFLFVSADIGRKRKLDLTIKSLLEEGKKDYIEKKVFENVVSDNPIVKNQIINRINLLNKNIKGYAVETLEKTVQRTNIQTKIAEETSALGKARLEYTNKYLKSRTNRSISSNLYNKITEKNKEKKEEVKQFTTTEILTDIVQIVAQIKGHLLKHYSTLQNIIQSKESEEVLGVTEENQDIYYILQQIDKELSDVTLGAHIFSTHLHYFVKPLELVVWHLYLKSNGLLENENYERTFRPGREPWYDGSGKFFGGVLIESYKMRNPETGSLTMIRGRNYLGLASMSDQQAYYLYHIFVEKKLDEIKDRFSNLKQGEGASRKGHFIVQDARAGRFEKVFDLPDPGFLSLSSVNQEKADLIKEMKVCVIEFFLYYEEKVGDKKTIGISDSIPEGTEVSKLFEIFKNPDAVKNSEEEVDLEKIDPNLKKVLNSNDRLSIEIYLYNLVADYDDAKARLGYNEKIVPTILQTEYMKHQVSLSQMDLDRKSQRLNTTFEIIKNYSEENSILHKIVSDLERDRQQRFSKDIPNTDSTDLSVEVFDPYPTSIP